MNGKDIALLLGVAAVRTVAYAPKALVKSVGFGYDKRFELEDLVIERPEDFKSNAQKAAFEDVGRYVTNFLTRDVMLAYMDDALKQDNFLRPKNVPIPVWHEVLEYFRDQGAIEQRWELRVPHFYKWDKSTSDCSYAPSWDKDGMVLDEKRDQGNWIGGFAPTESSYSPGLLTDEQKAFLIGVDYAMCRVGDVPELPRHKVREEDFARVFYRNREALTNKSKEKGAETLAKILIAASKG